MLSSSAYILMPACIWKEKAGVYVCLQRDKRRWEASLHPTGSLSCPGPLGAPQHIWGPKTSILRYQSNRYGAVETVTRAQLCWDHKNQARADNGPPECLSFNPCPHASKNPTIPRKERSCCHTRVLSSPWCPTLKTYQVRKLTLGILSKQNYPQTLKGSGAPGQCEDCY